MLYYPVKLISKIVDIVLRTSRLYDEYIRGWNPTILESATGFAVNLNIVLEKALSLNGKVYTIDIGHHSISWARLVYKDFIKKGVLVVETGDLRKLHYNDSTFDYSVNHTTMHHIDEKEIENTIKELQRTLKKGGILILVDINPLPIGVGLHSPSHLRKVKETVRASVGNFFTVIETGERRLVYYIVAEKP